MDYHNVMPNFKPFKLKAWHMKRKDQLYGELFKDKLRGFIMRPEEKMAALGPLGGYLSRVFMVNCPPLHQAAEAEVLKTNKLLSSHLQRNQRKTKNFFD